jgi:hypothetical protein
VRSLPPIGAKYSAECFGPVATGRGKRRNLKKGRRRQVPSDEKQPVLLMRKVHLEQQANGLLEDLAQFIGISAEELLNIVLRTVMANDADFQRWRSQRRIQQESSPVPLEPSANAENREAA